MDQPITQGIENDVEVLYTLVNQILYLLSSMERQGYWEQLYPVGVPENKDWREVIGLLHAFIQKAEETTRNFRNTLNRSQMNAGT